MSTLNRNIGVARRVLRLAATVWREAASNLPRLAAAPLMQLESDPTARKAYPLDWEEQQLLFSELAPHLQRMASPAGFKNVRVHDPRHTFGRRLRAAGVSFEDRQDLLVHRSTRVTDCSAAELRNLLSAANRLKKSRNDRIAPDGMKWNELKWLI